jgi:hypothetical protein
MTIMGHGATDANGIYRFGELDNTGPYFSDFLDLAEASISAAIGKLQAHFLWRKLTAPQSITSGTASIPVTAFDSIAIANSLAGFTFTASTGKAVCAVAGAYHVNATAEFSGNTTGSRFVVITRALAGSPTTFATLRTGAVASAAGSVPQQVQVEDRALQFAIGDVLQIGVYQNSGATLTLNDLQLDIRSAV